MTEKDALDILRAQGYAVGSPDDKTNRVPVWVHGSDQMAEVDRGQELTYLAEGKITLDEVVERHERSEQTLA